MRWMSLANPTIKAVPVASASARFMPGGSSRPSLRHWRKGLVERYSMQTNDAELSRHFAMRPCSHCQQPMQAESVLIVARRSHTLVIMAVCSQCHHRGLYVLSLPQEAPPTPSPAPRRAPISSADVRAMRVFLDTFDGNFQALFGIGSGGQ
jgi:RNase P subunit RPR2